MIIAFFDIITFQKVRHVFQLWNVVFPIAAIFNHQWKYVIVFSASMRWVEFGEFTKHYTPSLSFLFGVFDSWNRLATVNKL